MYRLYSFCANLLHSLTICLIVSSWSPHNEHLLFCCVLSILALIWLIIMALFCAAIWNNSVSLLRFPLLTYVHIFSCETSLVSRLKHPYSCFSSQILFSGYFWSADPCVISIILGDCNQFSSVLFYVVFKSLYQCVNSVIKDGKPSSSFFSWHI